MDYNSAALCYSRMVDYAIVEWMDHAIVEWIILFSAITNYDIMTSLIIGYIQIVSLREGVRRQLITASIG